MSQNLFALCRKSKNDSLSIYKVPLDANTQSSLITFFDEQKNDFFQNIDEEIPYNGMWKIDSNSNQLLTIEIKECPEVRTLQETANNPSGIEDIDTKKFMDLGIKALFTKQASDNGTPILVQNFTKKQMLEHKFTLWSNNNTFTKLTDSSFSLDDKLCAVIDGKLIKFKSFHILRSILNIGHLFKAATEAETAKFLQHPLFFCASADICLKLADEPMRKTINSIQKDGILNIEMNIIRTAAQQTGYDIEIENNKIILPTEKKTLKTLLCFLNGDIYNAPITKDRYITNSKRKY